ncbi:NAD(P)-binding protein [Fistulina hepatica ATCC 64428]|uniref:NAD(P)-binding protein n=1 Tax=Fistulina hepatica ATCC 64428 TaxID=1128425 RepID=A0A0D7A2Y3_9AGAR|nr:NAD(P)-binding protein [Fistulina hepatica ATCC 64428]
MPSPRVWFVTGSSTGFGRTLTELALSKGDRVVATLRKPHVLDELVKQYEGKDQLLVLKLDVTKRDEVESTFKTAFEKWGRIDIVFSNAGWGIIGEIESTSEKAARDQMEANFWGAAWVAIEAIKYFRDFNKPVGGKLMHMSSMFGIDVSPGAGYYCATKFASEAMIEAINREVDPSWNIKVTILCPGWFRTPMVMANPVVEPAHPAYAANPNLPSMLVRQVFGPMQTGESPLLGDPKKLIQKFWDLSLLEEMPLHVPFGEDARACFERRYKELKADFEATERYSQNLTFDSKA